MLFSQPDYKMYKISEKVDFFFGREDLSCIGGIVIQVIKFVLPTR